MQTLTLNPTFPALSDKFVFDAILSRGPLAGIVRARDVRSNTPLAIKRFPIPAWMTCQEAEERHQRMTQQVEPLLTVEDSHLAPVFEFGAEEDSFFVVREFVEGIPFASVLHQSSPLPLCETRRMAYEIAGVLDKLDAAGLQHGRLTPSNILLREDGSYQVTDAILWGLPNDFTAAGRDCHLRTRTEARCDLHALARIVFEALVGSAPQAPESALHAYHLPHSTRYALYRALSERKRGYKSVSEFASALAPTPTRVLFRQAWRPAVAVGLLGALGTVGANAASESHRNSQSQIEKSAPVIVKTAQELAEEAALAQMATLSAEDKDALSLAIRRQGIAVLLHPPVAEFFQLTDTQILAIRHRLGEQREKVAEIVEKSAGGHVVDTSTAMKEIREHTASSILKKLDAAQRILWNSVTNHPTSPDIPVL